MRKFTRLIGSDIQDDSETLEIFVGQNLQMAVSILLDDSFEIYPPDQSHTYSASDVAEILEFVVPFVIETIKGNAVDRKSDQELFGKLE